MYEDRIIAFIDILGFSDSIRKTIENGVENELETKKIDSLLQKMNWFIDSTDQIYSKSIENNRIVNQFSDTIIISYLITEEAGISKILSDILHLCIIAIQKGFLLRGAIVCDKLYHTENKIFGPALVKAYEMENKMAIYPRIILDNNILEIAKIYHHKGLDPDTELNFIKKRISIDFDGLYYVNYFDFMRSNPLNVMTEHLECISKIINDMKYTDKIGVKSKYLWLKEKYDIIIKNCEDIFNDIEIKNKFPHLYE